MQLQRSAETIRKFESDPFGLGDGQLQLDRARSPAVSADDTRAFAARGVAGAATPLPFADTIQRSFGHHDVSGIEAHVGGAASDAARAIGASAYATGNQVAFAGAPDLHTAAHVVQQRGGVQLKGGVGEVGDEYERHADAVADKVVRGESAAALLDERGGNGEADVAAAAIQRRQTPPAETTGPELVVPERIEFDDLEVGQRQRRETILWNPGASEVRVTGTELAIDQHQKQFQVRQAPERIMPTSSPVAATSGKIVIDFVPQGEGLRKDTLRLTVKTIDAESKQRVFAIVLAGRAHAAGQPTYAEKQAADQGERERAADRAADADHEESREERTRRNMDDPRVAPTGRLEAFDAKLDDIRDDIRTIDDKRKEGITVVEREAAAYVRPPSPTTRTTWDYLREGATLALTFASYGLARGVASALIPDGGSRRGPAGIGVGIDADGQAEPRSPSYRGIQKSIEKALGTGMEWAIQGDAAPAPGAPAGGNSGSALSADPSLAFFASQRVALGDSRRARLAEITRLGPELVDQIHDAGDFKAVLGVLAAVRAELGNVAGTRAAEEQSKATAAQWLSFVSKRSGATHAITPSEGAVKAGAPHADQVSDLRPLDEREGVIEISFSADLEDPASPVRIGAVRVLGVARQLADRVRGMSLLEAQVPVRAVARDLTYGGHAIADPALAVARNEVGEIDVAAGKPGELPETNQQARYLAAKAAPERQHRRQDADVKAGGRRVVEQELAGQWASVLTETNATDIPTMPVRSDDASQPND